LLICGALTARYVRNAARAEKPGRSRGRASEQPE
jgi:hypothetical protein